MRSFFIVFLSLLVPISQGHAQITSCEPHQCITVIDAGSTGSRIHIYSYDRDQTNTPSHISELWSKKINPGFATIEPKDNTIEAYLSLLLSDAPIQEGPVYFYATAGMRLLPPSKQELYYQKLKHWFAQQNQWHLVEAKTITGQEEALYDWLSVNYHLDTLKSSQKKPIGVMDMGGASVQIVFPIQNQEENNRPLAQLPKKEGGQGNNKRGTDRDRPWNSVSKPIDSTVELDLYGQHYTLSVHSFLGLGQNEVTHHFLNSASCFSNNYPLPDGKRGRGNAPSCEQEISGLINWVHGVNKIIPSLLKSNPVESWYVIGALSNLADNNLFLFQNNQITSQTLIQRADSEICHQQWDTLSTQYPNDDYLYGYCLFSAYFYALIVEGYGIHPEHIINYIPFDLNVDWTKGVVLTS